MFLRGLLRFLVTSIVLLMIGLGMFDYLKNFDENECSMTYMKQSPGILPVELPQYIKKQFPNYKLYLYCEGYDCQQYESLTFTQPGHIPVLFVPGNADSHMQVRSMASVGLDKSRKQKYSKLNIKFQYFTISFNEELSALYGPLLDIQTKYVQHCIRHILTLFKQVKPENQRPKNVLLIGNSMGGLVSRGIFVKDTLPVHTIITKSTPHNRPVINIDKDLAKYYKQTNEFWLNKNESKLQNVVLASLYGGTRDILVRSGLANIHDWKSKSSASIISSYTVTMPNVWRSIDHRCMAWCRELVMALNRALFQMIDPKTLQISNDRAMREKILRFHLEKDVNEEINNYEITRDDIEIISDSSKMAFEYNAYTDQEEIYAFDLTKILNVSQHDSLFIYTNINEKNSFLLCIELNECKQMRNLMVEYGQSMPPYLEGFQKESSLKTINVFNLDKLMQEDKFAYLLVRIPVNSQKFKSIRHQTIVKFDWYLKSRRIQSYQALPNMLSRTNELIKPNPSFNFQRVYLPTFLNTLQVFDVRKQGGERSCDSLLIKLSQSNMMTSLAASTLMIQFNEPPNHIVHSQAIQSKNKNISLFLSKSISGLNDKSIPYIDLIQFDPRHLIFYNDLRKYETQLSSCSKTINFKLDLNYNWSGILGQFVRFYLVFVLAYLVVILQFYDYLTLRQSQKRVSERVNISYKSFFLLNKSLTHFMYHFEYSIFLTLLNYFFELIYMSKVLDVIDPARMIFFKNDYELLIDEKISLIYLPFLLYWSSYGILSIASFFLSFIIYFYAMIINSILMNVFGFLNNKLIQNLLTFLHLIATIASGVFVSTIAHVSIFYAELIQMAAASKAEPPRRNYLAFATRQTRLFLIYILLILNLSPLLVWTKTLNSSMNASSILPLNATSKDNGYLVAILNLLIYTFLFLKNRSLIKSISLSSTLIANLVIINSILTVVYSTVSLYRLQYFVIVHLVLMSLNSIENLVIESNKSSQLDDDQKSDKIKDD